MNYLCHNGFIFSALERIFEPSKMNVQSQIDKMTTVLEANLTHNISQIMQQQVTRVLSQYSHMSRYVIYTLYLMYDIFFILENLGNNHKQFQIGNKNCFRANFQRNFYKYRLSTLSKRRKGDVQPNQRSF